ncbi:MAG: YceI family protein [Sphingobium sp.]
MRAVGTFALALAAASAGVAIHAQQMPTEAPGKHDTKLISGGTYEVDPGHTQVLFAFDHMGFTKNMGIIAEPASGCLTLDPEAPEKAKVAVTFPVKNIRTGVPGLDEHLMNGDFFDAENFPTATFTSTSVKVDGTEAEITGNLTIKGKTKEVTLDADFVGAGTFAMGGKASETVGFNAQAIIKRSDFDLGYGIPLVADTIELKITAGFEKPVPAK